MRFIFILGALLLAFYMGFTPRASISVLLVLLLK